jgi:uncharacterized membrane protein
MNTTDYWISVFYQIVGQVLYYPHPIHPTMVHLPIGLVFGAFLFLLVSLVFRKPNLAQAARMMVALAFISWFFTVFFGLIDWRYRYGGAWLFFFKAKMVLSIVLFSILALLLILRRRLEERRKTFLALYALGFLTVIGLGFFGGQLTYSGETPSAPEIYKPGEWQYQAHCSACHPCGGNVIDTHRPVYHSPLTKNPQTFKVWVRQPASPMPAFTPTMLTDKEIRDLFDYISQVINAEQEKK